MFLFIFIQYLVLSAYLGLTFSFCDGSRFLLITHLSAFSYNGLTEAYIYFDAHIQH